MKHASKQFPEANRHLNAAQEKAAGLAKTATKRSLGGYREKEHAGAKPNPANKAGVVKR